MANITQFDIPFSPVGKLYFSEINKDETRKANWQYLGRTQGISISTDTTTVDTPNLETAGGGTWGASSDLNAVTGLITIANWTSFNWGLLLGGDVVSTTASNTKKVVDVPLIGNLRAGDFLPFDGQIDFDKEVVVGFYVGQTPTEAQGEGLLERGVDYEISATGVEVIKDTTVLANAKLSITAYNATYDKIDMFRVINRLVALKLEGANRRSEGNVFSLTFNNVTFQLPSGFDLKGAATGENSEFELPFQANQSTLSGFGEFSRKIGV